MPGFRSELCCSYHDGHTHEPHALCLLCSIPRPTLRSFFSASTFALITTSRLPGVMDDNYGIKGIFIDLILPARRLPSESNEKDTT
jgi:hypothetical protein